ncbi:hypothetical protein F5887DRAFT_885155 [Amanita rubescens]|nr:hypothetical protein F5887DRAFT_885155 [Amanita rubescens]
MSESGMPLLSGLPPPIQGLPVNSSACRKCNKEFNVIFTRSRKCQHCGYQYCSACSDYQALMPRYGTVGAEAGTNIRTGSGYDVVNVCAFCSEFLQITAAGKNYLKSLPLSKLRKYANAYDVRIDHAIEKEDVIEAVLSARGPNGCLPPDNERFYRKYSVPDRTAGGAARPRGLFSRSGETYTTNTRPTSNLPPRPRTQSRPEFSRPDLEPDPPYPTPPEQQEPRSNRHQSSTTQSLSVSRSSSTTVAATATTAQTRSSSVLFTPSLPSSSSSSSAAATTTASSRIPLG